MYPFGLVTLLEFLWEHELPSLFVVVAIGSLLSVVFLCHGIQRRQDAPAALSGFPLFNITAFLTQQHDFLAWGFRVTSQQLFQFRLLRNNVVVVSGERGRKDFFNARGLDLQEGFRILSGMFPILSGVTTGLRQQRVARIYKRLANVQRNERLTDLIPEILNDIGRLLQPWEKAGTLDPFEKIYEMATIEYAWPSGGTLTFQTTVRCLTCAEIADDPEIVARLRKLYNQVDRGTTPATVLFPWFPSPSMIMKARATKKLHDIIVKAINVRKESGVPHNDTLQISLDAGEDMLTIVGFMMGFVTAGARSTGTAATWLFTYLGCHPKWRNEARAEISKLVTSHSFLEAISERNSPHSLTTTTTALSSVPLSAWENETPVLDKLIHETLRIAQPHIAMRRNVGPDIYIDGKVIPTGTLVVYPLADVHLNPTIYPDPWKFDPERPQPKGNLAYLGWGGGRVICLGSRLARLQIKLLAALLLIGFDFETVDASGRIANPPPKPNWNDAFTGRPALGQYFLRYRRLESSRPPGHRPSGAGAL